MRRRLLYLAIAALTVAALGSAAVRAQFSWAPSELGSPVPRGVDARGPHRFRAVTFNTFRLAQRQRVGPVLEALETSAALLATGPARPELIALQEIESRDVAQDLRERLSSTHRVAVCECATNSDGSLRSAVLLAASRESFAWRSHRCVPLDREWPDHPRCAVVAELAHGARPLRAVAVHLAWHFDNAPMATRLRVRARIDASTVAFGDFNTWSGAQAHSILKAAPLADPFAGGPATHFVGAKLDHVFVGRALVARRGLAEQRRALYDALAPTDRLFLPAACDHEGPPACPLSDHLPEGALLEWR